MDDREACRAYARGRFSRRQFLRLGGAGCGGEQAGGATSITLSFAPDEAGGLEKLIREFNERNRGEIQVKWREMPAASADYFEQIQAELQSGKSTVDVIGGDAIWPAQFAANGWILGISDRFTEEMKGSYLDGPLEAVKYEGKTWGVPWFTDAEMFYYRTDLLEQGGFSGRRRLGRR